jgi:hypothetical protein
MGMELRIKMLEMKPDPIAVPYPVGLDPPMCQVIGHPWMTVNEKRESKGLSPILFEDDMNETEIEIFKALCSKGNTPEEATEVIREMRTIGA